MTVPNGHNAQSDASDPLYSIACPICSGDSLKTLHCFTAKQAAGAFFPVYRDEMRHTKLVRNIDGLWKRSRCTVVQCDACQFTFPIPYVGGTKSSMSSRTGYQATRAIVGNMTVPLSS